MRISEGNGKLMALLEKQYDSRESKSIARIFWEDLFNHKGGMDRALHTREVVVFRLAMEKLEVGIPIQYVTGVSFFYNLKLAVSEAVLIPRPETEELVYQVLSDGVGERVLDIGTGSGCIPIVIKKNSPDCDVVAVDISQEALKVAKINAEKHEVQIQFRKVNFLDESSWAGLGMFHTIISNPPYISRSEQVHMSQSTLNFEPDLALYPESEDVLIFYRKIARFGLTHLRDEGKIYLECNEFNLEDVVAEFSVAGYKEVVIIDDMQGKPRIVVASTC